LLQLRTAIGDVAPTGNRSAGHDRPEAPMTDPYARYTRLRFDRPHPKVLRVTLDNGNMNTADAALHASLALEFLGFTGPEVAEGPASHLEKRKPVFPLPRRSDGVCHGERNATGSVVRLGKHH
jgi:hypothetical protein